MPQTFLKFSQVTTISDKMARQGAALQNYNNELVKSLEELCQRRHNLQVKTEFKNKKKLFSRNNVLYLTIQISL